MRLEWEKANEISDMRQERPGTMENDLLNREMDEFRQYAMERPEEAISLSTGGFNEQGRFVPGKVEEINPEAAEFDPEMQELTDELDSWIQQSERMSCAVASQTMAVNQLLDENYPEKELLDIAKEQKWYEEGTCPEDVGKVAEHMGMEVEQRHGVAASELRLANDPEVKVLANIDSTLLQYPGAFKRCQPDHCVQVLRVESTAQGEMVILNDPGHAEGQGAVYPMEVFERAYKGDITTIRKAEGV